MSTPDDVRAALQSVKATEAEAAPEPVDSAEAALEPAAEVEAPEPQQATETGRERDESGRFKQKQEAKPEPKAAKATEQAATKAPVPDPKAVTPTAPPVPGATAETFKPPQSWKPAAREKFAGLPPEVQAEIARVDKEVAANLSAGSEHRKIADSFRQTVTPFLGMIQAEGSDPMRAVGNLLQTAAALRTAPPAHKAQLVAGLVQQFGIPLELLAEAIDGKAPTQSQRQPQQFDPAQFAAKVKQELMQEFGQQRQQTTRQQADQDLEKFAPTAEFLDDVRAETAAIMEAAIHRGQTISLQEAYDRACYAHPDVRAIIQQREAAKSAASKQAEAAKARAAASSPRGSPVVAPPSSRSTGSTRDDVEAAIAAARGRT